MELNGNDDVAAREALLLNGEKNGECLELKDKLQSDTNAANYKTSTANDDDKDDDKDEDEILLPFTKKSILKNVFVASISFTFLFTAFQSISNLQTSLNKEDGIGSISLALIYASVLLSCFLPKFFIARLGCKTTIVISMVGYILYMGANFYAVKATMFIAAICVGMGAGPLWTSQFTYLTQKGVWYAKITNQNKDAVISRFFGFFFLLFQTSQVWGNLIASLVFTPPVDKSSLESSCGAQFCGNATANFQQDIEKVYIVCGSYLACSIVALIILAVFLDPITLDHSTEEDKKFNPKLLLATFKHVIKSPIQVMLIPITLYCGVERAFITGEYTKAYISCSIGIWNLGYVMICFGVVDAVCSFIFGHLVKYVGRIPFFCLTFLVHGATQIVLLLWEPSADQEAMFYVFAGLWAIGDAVLLTQLNALYGDVFSENTEAGFANYRLWEALGYTIAFAYNDVLCTDTKLYICLAVLAAALIGYIMAEVSARMKKTKKADDGLATDSSDDTNVMS